MLPVTHYLYLGLGLFAVGLCGAVLRRSMIVALLGVQLMLAAAALLLCAYGRVFFDANAQVMAGLVLLVGLCELAVTAAVVLRSANYDASAPDEQRGANADEGQEAGLLADWTLGGPG